MWGLAGQFVVHSVFSLLAIFQVWRPLSRPQADSVSLRLGHGAGLTAHRAVIQHRAAASLPCTGEASRCGGVWADEGIGPCKFYRKVPQSGACTNQRFPLI